MNIALVGAFDRYNYGDVLMPIVVKKELEKKFKDVELSIDYYGLVESDMEFCRRNKYKKIVRNLFKEI